MQLRTLIFIYMYMYLHVHVLVHRASYLQIVLSFVDALHIYRYMYIAYIAGG